LLLVQSDMGFVLSSPRHSIPLSVITLSLTLWFEEKRPAVKYRESRAVGNREKVMWYRVEFNYK
jgi:hypothetical protein